MMSCATISLLLDNDGIFSHPIDANESADRSPVLFTFGADVAEARGRRRDMLSAFNHRGSSAALIENNEASAKLTTANGGTFT